MITNQQRAQELLEVLGNSQSHNPAWALKEVLEKLREKLTLPNGVPDWGDAKVYVDAGWNECLREIDDIANKLEAL
jgi:tRNA uridine 5-carbamoylmethylation protein Kti12